MVRNNLTSTTKTGFDEIDASNAQPIDYLVIGHVTNDIQPDGTQILGGTVSFAANMARALGLRVGIVTCAGKDSDLSALDGIAIACERSKFSTTFENRYDHKKGRVQYLYNRADDIDITSVPSAWWHTEIVHFGPMVDEISPHSIKHFPNIFKGITAQGWLRRWDESGRVHRRDWPEAAEILPKANAVVISIDDVEGDWVYLDNWGALTRVLVITQGAQGATVIVNGDRHQFRAPQTEEMDSTGAGDIFAAAFFIRYQQTDDPLAACRYAVRLASASCSRVGPYGLPTPSDIIAALDE